MNATPAAALRLASAFPRITHFALSLRGAGPPPPQIPYLCSVLASLAPTLLAVNLTGCTLTPDNLSSIVGGRYT
jgi:hypothetical protein